MIAGSIEIQLMADIARLRRDMDGARQVVSNATAGMSRAADAAKAALAGIGLGMGLSQVIQMSDQYTKFTAQLRLASQAAREYAASYGDVRRIANDSQQELGATGMLYARIANGTRELGVAQKRVADITEVVNLSLKVSGAAASESASAQLQLSQAFASGTLRGEEFNAVNEAAPRLMLALADGIGVPVGALKKMAEAGEITSKIMADVLPNALAQLREEGKQVQTISGAFTVLKNNVMEFLGVRAEANGTVAVLTGGIGMLANNLNLVMAVLVGLTTVKIAAYFFTGVGAVQAYFAANAELAALVLTERAALIAKAQALVASTTATVAATTATLAEAEAAVVALTAQRATIIALRENAVAQMVAARNNIVAAQAAMAAASAAGAQSFALRTLRLATAELAVAEQLRVAAMAEIAALGIAQARISAQITAATAAQTAAATANAAATTAQAAAMAGAAGAAGRTAITASLATRALGFLGGPIGIVTTLLSLGAAAWVYWGSKSKESNEKATAAVNESTTEMIGRLDKQIAKLKERNALRDAVPMAKGASDADVEGLARAKADMDAAMQGTGRFAERSANGRALAITNLTENYEVALRRVAEAQRLVTEAANGKKSEQIRQWFGENGTAAQKLAYELEGLRKKYGELPPAMEAAIRAKHADKGAATAVKQEETAYTALVTSIGEKIAAGKLEMNGYEKLSDAQKMTIKLDEAIISGKNKLTPKHIEEARAMIATVAAQDAIVAAQKRAAEGAEAMDKIFKEHGETVAKSIENANKEAEKNKELSTTFGMTKSAIEQLELVRMEEQLAQRASVGMTTDEIAALEKLIAAKRRSAGSINEEEAKQIGLSLMTDEQREQIAYEARLGILQGYHNRSAEQVTQANAWIEAETKRHEKAKLDIKTSGEMAVMSMVGSATDQLHGLLKQAGAEQTAIGKAAFIASKALAVAQIIMSTNVAAATALAPPPLGLGPVAGLGYAGMIKAMGYASAGMTAGLAIAEVAGGRASGGPVDAGKLYEVNERGPELLSAGGRDYLMMGARGGSVTPNNQLGQGSGGQNITLNQTLDIHIDGTTDMARNKQMVRQAVQQGSAELVDRLQRAGRI